jgi:hypothetical protein
MSSETLDLTGLNNVTLSSPAQYGFVASVTHNAASGTFTVSDAGNFNITSSPDLFSVQHGNGSPGVSVRLTATPDGGIPGVFFVSAFQSVPDGRHPSQLDNVSLGLDGGTHGMKVLGWNADSILLQDTTTPDPHEQFVVISDQVLNGGTPDDLVFGTSGPAPFGLVITTATCFAEGTKIRTPSGAVAVEDLAEGDLVCTLAGLAQTIGWIGRSVFDCVRHPQPARVMPVQIEANAFGPGLPSCSLQLSPEHAVFADGAMVPVHCLVNGTTIRQMPVPAITYYHIELPHHDVVFAEGLPAETYLDTGNRRSLVRRDAGLALAA